MDLIDRKNKCYDEKLEIIKSYSLYNEIMSQFTDTLKVLKTVPENFGVPERVETKIDEAIFLTKDKTKCLLIVLERNDMNYVFGTARMIRGIRNNARWTFHLSLLFSLDRNYFSEYEKNSFDNISKLARYSVLADGDVTTEGCEIDEYFWFVELTK